MSELDHTEPGHNPLPNPHDLPRRTVLKGAGLGIGAGLLAGLVTPAKAAPGEIWSAEYWAAKGNVKLNLWRKRVGAPAAGEAPRPLIFLVHGSSNSARSSYDLTVPGKGEYSLMNVLARYGYDVWTMDHDGYGYSGLRGEFDGNSTNDDLLDFYQQLQNGDRQFVILPQTAHSSGYSRNRHLLYYALHNFLAAPAPAA